MFIYYIIIVRKDKINCNFVFMTAADSMKPENTINLISLFCALYWLSRAFNGVW